MGRLSDDSQPAGTGTYAPLVADWTASTAYTVGQLVTNGGQVYRVSTAHTSTGSFDATKFTSQGGTLVASVTDGDTTHAPTADAVYDAIAAVPDVSLAMLGSTGGVPIKPWAVPPTIGPELWVLAGFIAGSTLTPSLTANNTAQSVESRVFLGNMSPADCAFRLTIDLLRFDMPGWAGITVALTNNTGTVWSGLTRQTLLSSQPVSPGPQKITFDFKIPPQVTGNCYLSVIYQSGNNNAGGTGVATTSVSLRQVAAPQRPIRFFESQLGSPGYPQVMTPLFNPRSGTWQASVTDLNADSALQKAIRDITAYSTDRIFQANQADADPDFLASGGPPYQGPTNNDVISATGRSMRIANNDQIMVVRKTDGSFEYRCNTHGGETLRSTSSPNLVYEVDILGDGTWTTWDGLGKFTRPAHRVRFTYNTQVARSAPDSDVFANVDHRCVFYPDGMMRMDRTTTFQIDTRISQHFEWMSSHDITKPKVGRIGSGLLVLDEVDIFPKVAPPASPTVSTSTTGGTLAAATYAYAITALGSGGETTPTAFVTVAATGTTSSNTVSWSAVTGAEGYRIYGRRNSLGARTLLATVGSAAVSWIDDGSAAPNGQQPPQVNTARQMEASTVATDSAISDKATWAVWYDPAINMCFGNIYDRDQIASRTGVAGTKVRLEGVAASITKNYINTYFTDDGSNIRDAETMSRLFPAGTVWTATHWAFTYCPADPVDYHAEIAIRAANLTKLATLYPAT